jgi:hypothetical protein
MRLYRPLWMGLLLLLGASTISCAEKLATVADLEGGGIRYRSMVGHVDPATFAKLASDFLSPATIKLGVIVVFGSPLDAALAGPRQQDHCNFDDWRAATEARTNLGGCPTVQEAIKIGSRISLRRVDRTCRRTTAVLAGEGSPLDLVVSGRRYEVLELSFSRPIGEKNSSRISANVYVRAAGVSTQELYTLTTHVRELTNATYLGVRLRSDAWFVTDCGFPAEYAFEDRGELPTKEAIQLEKTAACFAAGTWPIRCIEGTGKP